MKFIMPVLHKSEKLGIDNDNISWNEIGKKVFEETMEVLKAIENADKDNLGEELHDLIQISVTGLNKLKSEDKDILNYNHKHQKKLKERGWSFKGFLEIKFFRMKY